MNKFDRNIFAKRPPLWERLVDYAFAIAIGVSFAWFLVEALSQ